MNDHSKDSQTRYLKEGAVKVYAQISLQIS